MNATLRGALAGAAATLPMTVAMKAMQRALPPHEQYELPPQSLSAAAPRRAGAPAEVSRAARRGWLVPHVGFGAAAGALLAVLTRRRGADLAAGTAFGLAVWAASYLGWIPALELPQAGTDEPPRRNAMMMASHLVWGATTAALLGRHSAPAPRVEPGRDAANELAPHRGVR
jgi:hypothetical protein